MSPVTLTMMALALAMDALAVSITSGVTIRKMRLHHALRIAAFFGAFQAIMPIAGWSIGRLAEDLVCSYDHWIAFVLLTIVGGKMIYESSHTANSEEERADPLNVYILLTLAFATSIDAAAVGITLSFLNVRILQPALAIGTITFIISLAGTYIGKKGGDIFGNKAELAGGLVLIGIGVKILIEHLFLQ